MHASGKRNDDHWNFFIKSFVFFNVGYTKLLFIILYKIVYNYNQLPQCKERDRQTVLRSKSNTETIDCKTAFAYRNVSSSS